MPRRRSQSDHFFDDLLALFRIAPWWVGPPVILFVWLLFRYILPVAFKALPTAGGNSIAASINEMFSGKSVMLSPYITGAIGLLWLAAVCLRFLDSNRLERQTGLDSIRALSWREFELLLAEAFRRQGYSVVDTGGVADGGIDLILSRDGRTTLVQAKQWKAWNVGVKVVRELYGVQSSRGAEAAILVTSGRFTDDAGRFASQNSIELIDGQMLERMISGVQRTGRTRSQPASKAKTVEPEPIAAAPECPKCGKPMAKRTARRGKNPGQSFWGCTGFPACRGTRPMS